MHVFEQNNTQMNNGLPFQLAALSRKMLNTSDERNAASPRRLWNGVSNNSVLLNVAVSNSVCSGHIGQGAQRTNLGSVQW